MDPLTIVLSALSVSGSAVGDQAIKDASPGFKALLVRKFSPSQPKIAEHLDDYAQDAETWEKPVTKALREAGADRDQEVIDRATELLKQAEASSPGVTRRPGRSDQRARRSGSSWRIRFMAGCGLAISSWLLAVG